MVGIIEPPGRTVTGLGRLSATGSRTSDGDTLFEIGSITKVFAALLPADVATRDELAVPIRQARYLRPQTRIAERCGRAITLAGLAKTHSVCVHAPEN